MNPEARRALPLTVVVPCFGRHALTRKLLQSLVASPDRFEVILVDDASPQSFEPLAREFGTTLDLRYIRMPERRGPAAARNRGLREARHPLVGFTDNDCVVEPSWARQLAVYLHDAPPKVAGVGGRVLAAGDDVYSRYYTYHRLLDPYPDQSEGALGWNLNALVS